MRFYGQSAETKREIKCIEFTFIGLRWYFEWYPFIPGNWLCFCVQASTSDTSRNPFEFRVAVGRFMVDITLLKKLHEDTDG